MSTNEEHTEKLKQVVGGIQDEIQQLGVGTSDRFQRSCSNPPPPYDEAESSRQNILALQTKIEFPRFAAGDPKEWLDRAAQFFDFHKTLEDQKVSLGSSHLEGKAKYWWQWLDRTYRDGNQTVTWEKFAEEMRAWFGPTIDENFDEALSHIRQSGSLWKYQLDFQRLCNKLKTRWSQRQLVETFINGLKYEIEDGFYMFRPESLKEAICFARMREEQLHQEQHPTITASRDSQSGDINQRTSSSLSATPNHSAKMTYTYQPSDLIIYKAAMNDKWRSVSAIFDQYPELMTKTISPQLETPLMIAVGTKSKWFVRELCQSLSSREVNNDWAYAQNIEGNNVLHYAAKVGNSDAASVLLTMYNHYDLVSVRNYKGNLPLVLAASVGQMRILNQFILLTSDSARASCRCSVASFVVQIEVLIYACELFAECRNIIGEECLDSKGRALEALATKIDFYRNGSSLGFWGHLISSLMPSDVRFYMNGELGRNYGIEVKEFSMMDKIAIPFWWFLQNHASHTATSMKGNYVCSITLVKQLCKSIIETTDHDPIWKILGSAIATALRHGNYELIEECMLAYPSIIWYNYNGYYFFHYAIQQRQEKVFNLIYQMSDYKAFVRSQTDDDRQENVLHITAKLAPPHRLNIITGAALQMQRELQWFKEVERLVEPSYKDALNIEKKTPRMVFTEEHKSLLIDGQQWMKDTSASCTVVAALIITMTFAAVFQVPGGNNDDGIPVFLEKGAFMVFCISNAIAFVSSSTSVLMFLGVLTSRYAEEDFLYVLPKRLTIGLVSLFLSLAATLVTFGATLALMLQEKVSWITAPIVIVASIPVCLFGLLQFPLLVELVYSTYGRSIFHKQNNRMIH